MLRRISLFLIQAFFPLHQRMTGAPGGTDNEVKQDPDARAAGEEAARREPRPTAAQQSSAVADASNRDGLGRDVEYQHEPGKWNTAKVTANNTNGSVNLQVFPDNGGPFDVKGVLPGDGVGYWRESGADVSGIVTKGQAPGELNQVNANVAADPGVAETDRLAAGEVPVRSTASDAGQTADAGKTGGTAGTGTTGGTGTASGGATTGSDGGAKGGKGGSSSSTTSGSSGTKGGGKGR